MCRLRKLPYAFLRLFTGKNIICKYFLSPCNGGLLFDKLYHKCCSQCEFLYYIFNIDLQTRAFQVFGENKSKV